MSLETFNLSLFKALNASNTASHLSIETAIFIANDLLYIVFILLLLLWCYGDLELKKRAFKAVFLTAISLAIGFAISLFYDHPRPFVMGVGRTIIEHAPNASFPSDHMLIFSTIALSYLFSERKFAGSILLLCACAVAWSRVYLGVHFPLDMIGALIIALMVNLLAKYLWPKVEEHIMFWALKIYAICAKPLLQKGWVK